MGFHPLLSKSIMCDEAFSLLLFVNTSEISRAAFFAWFTLSQIVFLRPSAFFAFPYSFDEISYFLRNVYCCGYLHFYPRCSCFRVFHVFLFCNWYPAHFTTGWDILFAVFFFHWSFFIRSPLFFLETHIHSAVMFTHSLRLFLPVWLSLLLWSAMLFAGIDWCLKRLSVPLPCLRFYRKPFQIAGRLQLERHFYKIIMRRLPSCIRPFARNGLLRHCSSRCLPFVIWRPRCCVLPFRCIAFSFHPSAAPRFCFFLSPCQAFCIWMSESFLSS